MIASASSRAATQLGYMSVARSHVGMVRTLNEDRLLDRPDLGLWAIADGMGGHSHGDLAAEAVVAALDAVRSGMSGYALLADVRRALQQANGALNRDNGGASGTSACGSTVVALIAREDHYACLWAGDSRAYLWRGGGFSRLTSDHSVVQEMVDAGVLTEDARRHHPCANVITRAVGIGRHVELDQVFAPVVDGDIFLLCSDGLTACLDDSEIARLVGEDDGADRLIAQALARGAPDNVSVVLVRAAGNS